MRDGNPINIRGKSACEAGKWDDWSSFPGRSSHPTDSPRWCCYSARDGWIGNASTGSRLAQTRVDGRQKPWEKMGDVRITRKLAAYFQSLRKRPIMQVLRSKTDLLLSLQKKQGYSFPIFS